MTLNENCGYISQPQNIILTEKVWKNRLDAIEKVTGALNAEKKTATALCLENTRKALAYLESTGATQSPDIGAYKRYALDMVGAVVPNLIAFDICSVQAINNRIAMINFMKYHYGTTKGATEAGDVFADVRNFGNSDSDYTSDHVEGEELSESLTLDWTPVLPGTFVAGELKDNGAGKIVDADAKEVGTINYTTGEVTGITKGTAVSYGYANEHVPAKKIPSITLSVESLPIKAKTRRLAALWGFEASYELQKEYGQSMEDLLSTTAAGEINHEIDLEIMDKIKNAASTGSALTMFSTVPVHGVSRQDQYDSFLITLNQAANEIYARTQRIRPNYVLCGTNVATIISSIRTFKPSGETNTKGPYFAGTVGQFKVFVSPEFNADEWCMGYKGDTLLDAGFVYAPYMPITTTSMVQLEDMAGRKGWATMYGTRLVNDKMFLKNTIKHTAL